MKVTFITVGRTSSDWAVRAVEHYSGFLAKYGTVAVHPVRPALKQGGSAAAQKRTETERLLKAAESAHGMKIACDESGRAFSSVQFSRYWRQGLDRHGGRAVLIIGGPWGLDRSILDWADWTWSLGPMTLPHELALVFAMEQIARAMSIVKGESYHK